MIFSTHRLPLKIVTDNGTAFTSNEFRQFMEQNGIKHVTSAPYHPSSNGLAERAVQTFKRAIERMSDLPIQERLSKFLFIYRLTLHSTTGVAPAELLMGRRPHSLLDNLHPDISQRVERQQAKQKLCHDSSKPVRTFVVEDTVFAEKFSGTRPKWLSGTIAVITGPLSYVVRLSEGATVRRHVDSIRRRDDAPMDSSSLEFPLSVPLSIQSPSSSHNPVLISPSTENVSTPIEVDVPPPLIDPAQMHLDSSVTIPQPSQLRRSTRARQPPDRYK